MRLRSFKLIILAALFGGTLIVSSCATSSNADQRDFQAQLDELDHLNIAMAGKLNRGEITSAQYDAWYAQANQLHSQLESDLQEAGSPPPGATAIALNWMAANQERNANGKVYHPQAIVVQGTPAPVNLRLVHADPTSGAAVYQDPSGNRYTSNGAGLRDQNGRNYLWNGQNYVSQ